MMKNPLVSSLSDSQSAASSQHPTASRQQQRQKQQQQQLLTLHSSDVSPTLDGAQEAGASMPAGASSRPSVSSSGKPLSLVPAPYPLPCTWSAGKSGSSEALSSSPCLTISSTTAAPH